jgi:prophage antirepressor-like protein
MENQIQVFNNPQFGDIRTVGNAENPMFCLADVCKVLGLSAKGVNQRLTDEVISNYPIIDSLGRTQQALFVNEDGLYDVILDSRKPEARQFRKWVTSEVLPSIRKTGGYIATTQDDSPELIMARALQVAQSTIDRHKQMLQQANERITIQEQEIKKAAPKVQYVDNVLQSVNTYTSTQMSKELGLREAEQLHKILRDRGVMFKQSGQWLLTAKYCGCDYTKPRTHSFTRNDGSTGTSTTTVWTEKGRAFLHTLFGA